jgi:hypothetical protein
MQTYIAEWASPNFHHPEYWPFLVAVLGTFAVMHWSARPVRPRDLFLLVVSLYAGLCSIRMIPLFVLVAVPLVAKRLGNWPRGTAASPRPHAAARAVLNSGIVLAVAVFAAIHIARVIQRQPQAEAQHFPVGAVEFLATHTVSGPIFNHYDWGGYLVWRLHPPLQVFIDGRADLYEKQLLDQFADTYQFKGDWQHTLQRWNIRTVLVPRDSALATGLRISPGWTVSYEDAQSLVLTRTPHPVGSEPTPSNPANPGQ